MCALQTNAERRIALGPLRADRPGSLESPARGPSAPPRRLRRTLGPAPARSGRRPTARPSIEYSVVKLRAEGAANPNAAADLAFDAMARTIGDAATASGSAERLKAWWIYRLLLSPDPLGERLTLMWHNHFATSNRKVQNLASMRQQNNLLRTHARHPSANCSRRSSKIRRCSSGSMPIRTAGVIPTKTSPAKQWSCSRSASATTRKPTFARPPAPHRLDDRRRQLRTGRSAARQRRKDGARPSRPAHRR